MIEDPVGVWQRTPGMKASFYFRLSALVFAGFAPAVMPQSEAENNAYRMFYAETDAAQKILRGEQFLSDFKESVYRPPILQSVVSLYVQSQNWTKVMEYAEKLPVNLPNAAAQLQSFVYTYGMAAAQSVNNPAKIVEFGEHILAVEPNNLQAQIFVATTIPSLTTQDKAANDRAIELAKKAFLGVAEYFGKPKPAGMTDAQWTQARSEYEEQLHSALGLIYFNRVDYMRSAEHYQAVLKSNRNDSVAHYYLGLIYRNQAADISKTMVQTITALNAAKAARAPQPEIDELEAKRQGLQDDFQQIRDKALDELAMAAALAGPVAQQARDALENLYSTKNNDSLQGLDEFIAKKKSDLLH